MLKFYLLAQHRELVDVAEDIVECDILSGSVL